MHPTEVENAVDLAHQMIRWRNLVEIKGIKNWCSETSKLDRFWLEFSAMIPRLGGRAMKASRFSDAQKAFILKPDAGSRYLPEGRDQPGGVLQLEAEVRRLAIVAVSG